MPLMDPGWSVSENVEKLGVTHENCLNYKIGLDFVVLSKIKIIPVV